MTCRVCLGANSGSDSHVPGSKHCQLSNARALWAVRVLDAHARVDWVGSFRTEPESVDGEPVWLCHNDDRGFRGHTPDTARIAAAAAVFPTRPADVRAELGECP